MALYVYRYSNEAIPKYALLKPSSVAGRVEVLKVGDSPILATSVALTRATQSGVRIQVQELESVETPLLSDGTTTISPQDFIEPSPTMDGRVRKGTENIIGVAIGSAAAVVDARISVLPHRNSGQTTPGSGGGGGGGGPWDVTYGLGVTHANQTATLLAAKGGGVYLKNGADVGTALATTLFGVVNYDESIPYMDVKSSGTALKSEAADGASAVAFSVDTNSAWANATARLMRVRTNATDRFVVFAGGDINQNTSKLYWDEANSRLQVGAVGGAGIGRFHLRGVNGSTAQACIENTTGSVQTLYGAADTPAGAFFGSLSAHPVFLRHTNANKLRLDASALSPYDDQTGLIDLGIASTHLFRNLYLSGSVVTAAGTIASETGTAGEAIAANLLVKLNSNSKFTTWLFTDDPYLAYGVSGTAAAGDGSTFTVVFGSVKVPIKSDGTTVIAPGDRVEPSPTVNGRIRKGETNPIGIATTSAVAVLDTLCTVRL